MYHELILSAIFTGQGTLNQHVLYVTGPGAYLSGCFAGPGHPSQDDLCEVHAHPHVLREATWKVV